MMALALLLPIVLLLLLLGMDRLESSLDKRARRRTED